MCIPFNENEFISFIHSDFRPSASCISVISFFLLSTNCNNLLHMISKKEECFEIFTERFDKVCYEAPILKLSHNSGISGGFETFLTTQRRKDNIKW